VSTLHSVNLRAMTAVIDAKSSSVAAMIFHRDQRKSLAQESRPLTPQEVSSPDEKGPATHHPAVYVSTSMFSVFLLAS
jgi:hypothetical protein